MLHRDSNFTLSIVPQSRGLDRVVSNLQRDSSDLFSHQKSGINWPIPVLQFLGEFLITTSQGQPGFGRLVLFGLDFE